MDWGGKQRNKIKRNWCIEIMFLFQSHIAFQMQTHKRNKMQFASVYRLGGSLQTETTAKILCISFGLDFFSKLYREKGKRFSLERFLFSIIFWVSCYKENITDSIRNYWWSCIIFSPYVIKWQNISWICLFKKDFERLGSFVKLV